MPWDFRFRPVLMESLKGYNRARFFADLNAGLVVGVVALSLCIGLGIASGVTPQAGLYTGVIGGFLVSALGGSRVQIGGPAGAFVGMVAIVVQKYGFGGLMVCTALAGVIMFVMGAMRMGSLIKFVPHPLTMGFTCGIAVVIMATQASALLGLEIASEPAEIPRKIVAIVRALPECEWKTVLVALGSLLLMRFWPGRLARIVPGSIVVVLAGMFAVGVCGLDLVTIGSRFGEIPRGLPPFAVPEIDGENIVALVRIAFAIAMLGGIESLLSAVVADGLTDDRHDSNQELMAQGVANMVSPFFGGMPVTGVIARTATNIRSGGTTPVAGIVHACVLLVFAVAAAPLLRYIPLASLAAVLVIVALRMGEWPEFLALRRYPKGDAAVFLTAFLLTVFVDLSEAIYWGMLLSAFLFIKRVAETTQVDAMEGGGIGSAHEQVQVKDLPPGVLVYRVFGSLLFGAAEKLDYVIQRTGRDTRVVVLHVAAVTAMDATALARVEALMHRLHHHGRQLVLSGPHTQPYFLMENAGFFDELGRENVVADLEAAAARAREILAQGGTHVPRT